MKRYIKSIITVFLMVIIAVNSTGKVNAQINVPERVRIGLYYGDKAVSSLKVYADNGLELGYSDGQKFNLLYESQSGSVMTVRKDGYFVVNGNNLSEFFPTSPKLPEGEKIGPYHIRIGTKYNDLLSAIYEILLLKTLKIEAYPVFIGGEWYIWSGYFADEESATNAMVNIMVQLGKGEFEVVKPSSGRIAVLNESGDTVMMYEGDMGEFTIKPGRKNNPQILNVNGVNYRGDIRVLRLKNSDMTVINTVTLNEYLYGVVPPEIGYSVPLEALKAQAVVSRTYAINNIGSNKHAAYLFDLCNTTDCQVYKGYDVESEVTNKAIDETTGQIVVYEGEPAEVFFFSTSGGKTENSENVWYSSIPYLRSVDDIYESPDAPYSAWEVNITAEQIKEYTKGQIGDILSVEVTKRSETGRVIELTIRGTNGERVYKKEEARTILKLRSQWYEITTNTNVTVVGSDLSPLNVNLAGRKIIGANGEESVASSSAVVVGANGSVSQITSTTDVYNIKGRGWGHAVGMSQQGAIGMAKANFKYNEIVEYYFQGAKVQ